ncbi:TetR family transcriptional regulator [Actinorhabdospora filicis]|uniref:TetR family transcriptional regulator n=1 Tax=Actinorhabdospora filicis TaxID=1785913 RepID=A0A9W6SI71_9ACTN|nr:TetR/AcrR family transcriptional regulator [Actinorhabdospora filicis]GLZ76422.1 TetR family transcriptional regulator [Actinorhabdospora filicis]
MPRPRTFDEDTAVAAAMAVFRAHGYEATTTQALSAATGQGQSSLYNAFRSKHALFLRALRHYIDETSTAQLAILDGPGPLASRVRALVGTIIDDECGERLGCLVTNTALELAPRDEEVAAVLAADYERRTSAITARLLAARASGELPASADPVALAHFLNAAIAGIRVVARGGADRAALEAVAESAYRLF